MRIGEFIKKVETTKDTIRHYEELNLLKPVWINGKRHYSSKDLNDFYAIREMKSIGLSLKEIQALFEIKYNNGCGSEKLIDSVLQRLDKEIHLINEKEKELKNKKEMINELVRSLDRETGPRNN
ncbi:MerR family transcriptional regulator [Heyndrickxia sp. NPDC080065]|uniref:MerR family transcriptional regulator n=1 Tax=Heyndrickxia sp. NPDC080065 TaxID=3390568 RepID=UPI003D040F89